MNYPTAYQLSWVLSLTKGFRTRLVLYFVLEVVAIILSLLFVYWSKRAIDIALNVIDGNLRVVLPLVIGAVLMGLFIRVITGWLEQNTSLRMGMLLQNKLSYRQMVASWQFVRKMNTGDLMTRIKEDSNEVVQMVSYGALAFIVTGIRLLASFGFLWIMDPMLAIMIVAITPLFLFSRIYFRRMRTLTRSVKEANSSLANVMQENLRFRLLVRALGILPERTQRLEDEQRNFYSLRMKQLNFGLFSNTVMKLTINGGYLLTFIWGVYRLNTGEISFGTMTAFLQLVGRIQTPVLSLMAFVPTFIRFRVSLDRVLTLLGNQKEEEGPPIYLSNVESILIDQVSFRYEDATVISGLSAEIKRGVPTAIVGSSGKGKTTLIRLLLSLLEPEKGTIGLQSNRAIQALKSGHRTNFAYVPQGNSLFSGTIRDNLALSDEKYDEEKIKRVLFLAHAEFVYDLPDGVHTQVGESGYGLSEGQAQRIAIARALMRDRPIWLFDEATSALDEETSRVLVQRLTTESENKIMIFVTHDLRLAKQCLQTIYMH